MLNFLKQLTRRDKAKLPKLPPVSAMLFSSLDGAEQYFFTERNRDFAKLKAIQIGFPELRLDFSAESLPRLEKFYYANFVMKENEIGISRVDFEELITQYLRQLFVLNDWAKWQVFACEGKSGYYELGLNYGYGQPLLRQFGYELSQIPYQENNSFLMEQYLHHAPAPRAMRV